MKKSVWDIFAPIYERAMKSQIVSGRIDLFYAECAFLENENITGGRI